MEESSSPRPLLQASGDSQSEKNSSFQGAPSNASVGSALPQSFGAKLSSHDGGSGSYAGASPKGVRSRQSAQMKEAIDADFGVVQLGAANKFKASFARRGGGDAVDHCFYKLSVSQHRRSGYVDLFWFLVFLVLYFAMLFLQRQSALGYEVYTSLSGILPDGDSFQGTAEIEEWISEQVSSVWIDPECGDGVCVDPWEFPEYGRFGCRADCGRLVDVRNVTELQFDFYTNFTHPGIPSTELLDQASWNICPRSRVPHGLDCYFPEFQSFPETIGVNQVRLSDVPDGEWQVVVRGDIFQKVSGAIRFRNELEVAAVMRKKELAASKARATRVLIQQQLLEAAALAEEDNRAWVESYWTEEYEQLLESLRIANETRRVSREEIQRQVDEAEAELTTLRTNLQFAVLNCPGMSTILLNNALTGLWPPAQWDPASNPTAVPPTPDMTPQEERCAAASESVWAALLQRNSRVRNTIVNRQQAAVELLNQEQSGADAPDELENNIFVQQFRRLEAMTEDQTPEVLAVILEADGLDSLNPRTASLQVLTDAYANTQNISLTEVRLLEALTRYSLSDLASLARARAQEMTGWTPPVSPDPSPLPPYDLATFEGGADTYLTCDLENRAAEYDGSCRSTTCPGPNCVPEEERLRCESLCICRDGIDRITCSAEQFCACSACEVPRDDEEEIARIEQINESLEPLSNTESANATSAPADIVIQGEEAAVVAASTFTTTDAPHADVPDDMIDWAEAIARMSKEGGSSDEEESGSSRGRRRKLQQASQIDAAIQNAQDAQTLVARLENRVGTLTTYVEESARASITNDRLLRDLINSGQVQLTARQEQILSTLQTVIDRRNAAQELAERTFERLDQLTALSEQQTDSLREVQQIAETQLQSIQEAQVRGALQLSQALELLGRVRLQQEVNARTALLSNTICSDRQRVVPFSVQNYESDGTARARERDIGLSNKLLAGMLLHTTRRDRTVCQDDPFLSVDAGCFGDSSTVPYGVDPVFRRGAELYEPDFDTPEEKQIYYNCSAIRGTPTFDVRTDTSVGSFTTNRAPFCAELFNENDVPYGFSSISLEGYDGGYPLFFDINLSEQRSQVYLAYMVQGLYLDGASEQLTSEWVTYNSELRVYAHILVEFSFSSAGLIDVSHSINTLRTEILSSSTDYWRLFLEIVVFIAIIIQLAYNVYWIASRLRAGVRWGRLLSYGWLYFDLITIFLMLVNSINWWVFTFNDTVNFSIEERYTVYEDLERPANFLELHDFGSDLQAYASSLSYLKTLLNRYTQYYAIAGIVIIFNVGRMLKAMDFQPRLGIVTRSLLYAGSDLGHFFVMSGAVFMAYVLMGHLLFGQYIESFSSVSNSLTVCFALVLGDIEVNGELQALPGIMQAVGALFFWTYMILVFLVLLNFLLAIIVDAFSEVKSKTSDTIGVPEEVMRISIDKARSAMRMCGKQYINDRETRDVLKAIYKARKTTLESQEQRRELLDSHSISEARKSIPVGDKHITAESLANLFYTILDPAPMDEEMPGKALRPTPTLKVTREGCLPCCGKKEEAADLNAVANALVERFGEYEDDVEVEEMDGVAKDNGIPINPAMSSPSNNMTDELMRRLDELAQDRDRLARQVEALLAVSPNAQATLDDAAAVSRQKLAKGPGRSRLGDAASLGRTSSSISENE